jgi:hypothetical protein
MDSEAGPVARPYTLTGGRTRPRGERYFDLIDIVVRSGKPAADVHSLSPEHGRILDLCRAPVTVADLASAIRLPLGVVRVVLDDLVHQGLIEVKVTAPRGRMNDMHVLRQVLDGLRALLAAVNLYTLL